MPTKFIITRDDITESLKMFVYSNLETYHTVRIDKNGKQTCDIDISGYDIQKGDPNCPVPVSEFDLWNSAVNDFINDHNMAVKKGTTGNIVEFKITGVNENGSHDFEKSINGKKISTGTGFYKDLETDTERDAWIEAVKSYNKEQGIQTPTSTLNEQLGNISESIASLDGKLLGDFDPVAPLIVTAIPKLVTDPCDFLSYLSQATSLSIPLINGIPQPYEMASYAIKTISSQIPITMQNTFDAESMTAQACFTPVQTELAPSDDYFSDLDALYDEYTKTLNSDVHLFETVLEPAWNYTPSALIYENSEPGEYSYTSLPGEMDTGSYVYDPNSTEYSFGDDLNLSKVYDRGKKYNDSEVIRQRILDALKNFWIPLRKGWDAYARENDINPVWNVTSGYRPVGYIYTDGTKQKATGSAHIEGWAIDVQPSFTMKNKRERVLLLSQFIYNFLKENPSIQFDQILTEHKGPLETATSIWMHLGYKRSNGEQRRQFWPSYRMDAASGHHGTMYII